MKAWRLERLGGAFEFADVDVPTPGPGDVVVKLEASALMSYLKAYVEGALPFYNPPEGWFTPGGNGVGVIHAVGREVYHLKQGERVLVSSHIVANENARDPAQFLLGVTAAGPAAKALQRNWRDGTLADYVRVPKSSVTPVKGMDWASPEQLCVLTRFAVPFGGLIRGRLAAGETIIVTGATGAYGTAAVLLALALGAARIIAAGRNAAMLDALGRLGPRVTTVALGGDAGADSERLRAASGGGADLAFDMVGNARDANATLAALHSLRRGGRLVLMGSMTVPLPIPYLDVMLNDIEILGQFMYPQNALMRLCELARSELLDFRAVQTRAFPLEALPEAMTAAAKASGLECVVVRPS